MLMCILLNRYHHKAPTNWVALTTAALFFVILLLIGYILYGAENHIVKVEDFHKMEELKVRAEAAYVAKSRGIHTGSGSDLINVYHCPAVVFFFLLSFEKLVGSVHHLTT
ncbi:hypothetical protein RYX36_034139 [Vicia faba]